MLERTPAWRGYAWSAAACALVTLALAPLYPLLAGANIAMVYLLAVVAVALRFGRAPAVLAAFLAVASFDFFYVPPRMSFSVGDAQYLLTFAVMLVVALVVGQLTAGLKLQANMARSREARVGALYAMARELSGALLPEQIAAIGARFLAAEFDAPAALLVADLQGRLLGPACASESASIPVPAGLDMGVAQWAFDHAAAAGPHTDTLAAAPVLYLPLTAPTRTRGVLAVAAVGALRVASPDQRQLLDTCASLLAIALERVHYVEIAQSATVQMASERLRNSLLSAISHDLRTPLAALVAMAESLAATELPPASSAHETALRMKDAALRMNSLVTNLLDMARLQSGPVQLNLQWQPLEEVVGAALRVLQASLAQRRVSVRLAPELPLLHIDAVLFERVLCNLLENAAKYTPADSPIEIRAGVAGDRVEICVDDHGPGLPAGRETAIFDKFERGHKESATPGVGLGLAICRAIVEAHGGTIFGLTRGDGGARFVIALPRGTPPGVDGIEAPDAGAVEPA